MVKYIRNIDIAKGLELKKPTPSENKNKTMVRKSIVAIREIKKGEILNKKIYLLKDQQLAFHL